MPPPYLPSWSEPRGSEQIASAATSTGSHPTQSCRQPGLRALDSSEGVWGLGVLEKYTEQGGKAKLEGRSLQDNLVSVKPKRRIRTRISPVLHSFVNPIACYFKVFVLKPSFFQVFLFLLSVDVYFKFPLILQRGMVEVDE